jgi:hypothetical protein
MVSTFQREFLRYENINTFLENKFIWAIVYIRIEREERGVCCYNTTKPMGSGRIISY